MKQSTHIFPKALARSAGLAILGLCIAAPQSFAQSARNPAAQSAFEFERPTGFNFGDEEGAIDVSTRDAAGNRVIIDGLIVPNGDPSSLPVPIDRALGRTSGFANSSVFGTGGGIFGSASGSGSGQAIGNQLNIITNGSNNTVIVDSTQINNGNQKVVLNGSLNLDD